MSATKRGPVPQRVARYGKTVSASASKLLDVLISLPYNYPTNAALSAHTGYHARYIQSALKELQAARLITVTLKPRASHERYIKLSARVEKDAAELFRAVNYAALGWTYLAGFLVDNLSDKVLRERAWGDFVEPACEVPEEEERYALGSVKGGAWHYARA